MAKVVKNKKNIKLRKRIRKTFGTLFLVSALAVAAIPADSLQAQNSGPRVTLTEEESNIPIVPDTETIYTTGDGKLQFAYYKPTPSSIDKVAIILGYNSSALDDDGALDIPNTIDNVYLKYSDNLGSAVGYVAVGKSGNFLFYETKEDVRDENGNIVTKDIVDVNGVPVLDENGNIKQENVKVTRYYPCYYEDLAKWKDFQPEEFYYLKNGGTSASSGDASAFALTISSDVQMIQSIKVSYIGNQYLETLEDGTWKVAGKVTDGTQGVFADGKNIRNLTVGSELSGIGNYAFFGCINLGGIKLSNGLNAIGNYAFASCINLKNIDIDVASRIVTLGDHAFYDCRALSTFKMPNSVQKVGDSAFERCSALQNIVLTNKTEVTGEGANVNLEELGDKVFKDCVSLQSLTLPPQYQGTLNTGMIKGCSSLKSITVPDARTTFVNFPDEEEESGTYTLADFKKSVPEEFYFEGRSDSALHKTAIAGSFAFRYLNQDIYEMIKTEGEYTATYRVNKDNVLIYCYIDPGMENVEIPPTIGPYKVTSIGSDSFSDNCFLKSIEIPSSVTSIAENAFKGCHRLESVIFGEPVNLTSIGSNAFQTQQVGLHDSGCKDFEKGNDPMLESDPMLKKEPILTFTGPIEYNSLPFDYAMREESKINVGNQPPTYIKFYSGWPNNLTVQYNVNTDKNELIDYPTFSGLGNYTTESYPYMTEDLAKAASAAKTKYLSGDTLTDYEIQIINSALDIVLPKGIESIQTELFKTKEKAESEAIVDDTKVRKIFTTQGINEIAPYTFEGAIYLKEINILGDETTSIGKHAFKDCKNLTSAVISPTVSSFGVRPFAGCESVSNVDFQGSPYYVCENGIIYQLSDKNKTKIMECLEMRGDGLGSGDINANELEGILEIEVEAFMGCNGLGSVDLKSSNIELVPESAFESTGELYSVLLPTTCNSIAPYAFRDSALRYIEIPRQVSFIAPDAFDTNLNSSNPRNITFYCEDESNAAVYASNHTNIETTTKPLELQFTVYFWDFYGEEILKVEIVDAGEAATPPEAPEVEGYTFDKWTPDYSSISRDIDIRPLYNPKNPDDSKYTVIFYDDDDNVIKTELVNPGDDAEPPVDPAKEGYTFKGWKPPISNIQENTKTYAQFDKIDSSEKKLTVRFIDYDDKVLFTEKVDYGDDAHEFNPPARKGYTFNRWRPPVKNVTSSFDTYAEYDPDASTGTDDNTGNNGNNGNNGNGGVTTKFYTLTVQNGSGSGSYGAGEDTIVIANDPASGQEFSHWTVTPESVKVASKNVTATMLIMPESAVTITAHYKDKGSTTTGSGNTSTNKGSSNGGSKDTVTKQGGTTVVIDKNGLSNTGVITAKVNGSSDDFVIKITENAYATEQVQKALVNEYGDISPITYFPMDISLYDSTGQNKITDTSGLSISITLPIPDDMITYAGNNKIAGVVDERLDKLTPKFTTISGVSCITFTAKHFSPYVVYVDTANLTAGVVTDTTPPTGDGIHPKWFLSIGLACISMVMFLKKDKTGKVKAVVAS